MSEQKHSEDELFDSPAIDANDSSEDAASTIQKDEPKEPSKKDEESELILDPADEVRERSKQEWLKKIKVGDATIEDLKAKQPWLAELVSKELKAEKEAHEAIKAEKITDLAKKIAKEETTAALSQMQEKQKFDTLKAQLNAAGTTQAQRKVIEAEFNHLKGKLGAHDALDTAIKVAGVGLDDMSSRRKATAVPTLGGAVAEDDDLSKKVMNSTNYSQSEIQELARSKSKMYQG